MRLLSAALLAWLALAALPVAAGPWRDHGGARFGAQAPRQPPGGFERQPPQREFRRPERQPERRPDGRLTDQERHDLRRDLDRAHREIYKGR